MTPPADLHLVHEHFVRATALPRDERRAYLARHCACASMRETVERLLTHHDSASSVLDAPPAALEPGIRIDRFRVGAPLGRGGSGTVFRATDERTRRAVALKLLHPTLAHGAARRRFEREVAALARLDLPGVARLIASGVAETPFGATPYLAMERIDGEPVTTWARDSAPDRRTRLDVLAALADIVAGVHARGIVHRDLTPANVLITPRWQPVLLDFGIARLDVPALPSVTRVGDVIGTPAHMSPEQADGALDRVGVPTDVFALGTLIHEVLTGTPLIDDPGARRARHAAPRAKIDALRARDPAAAAIVATATARRPERRYPTATALAVDLRRARDDVRVLGHPAGVWSDVARTVQRHAALVAVI